MTMRDRLQPPRPASGSEPGRRLVASITVIAATIAAVLTAGAALGQAAGHISVVYRDSTRGDRPIPVEIVYPAQTAGDGVPIAPSGPDGYPVLAFGHAYKTHWSAYRSLSEALASAGYIVAFPVTEMTWLADHEAFAADSRFVVHKLQEEGRTDGSFFAGHVSERAALLGHSLGGGASVLAAADDPTIDGLAVLAALETTPSAIRAARQVTAPALLFCGSLDCITPPGEHQRPIYDNLQSSYKTLVTIKGGSHCQFAEPDSVCDATDAGCPPPTVGRARQLDLTGQLLLPWLDCILKDRPASCTEALDLLSTLTDITYEQQGQPQALVHVDAGGRGRPDPMHVQIGSVQPNPFQSSTEIQFRVTGSVPVSIAVFDLQGRKVRTLLRQTLAPGRHAQTWDGRDDAGRAVSSGIYMCRIESGGRRTWGKILLLR